MEEVERNKEKMFKLMDILVKLRGDGIDLKRKYYAIISEKEWLLGDYQTLETDKEALDMQFVIMEGKRNDLEARIS